MPESASQARSVEWTLVTLAINTGRVFVGTPEAAATLNELRGRFADRAVAQLRALARAELAPHHEAFRDYAASHLFRPGDTFADHVLEHLHEPVDKLASAVMRRFADAPPPVVDGLVRNLIAQTARELGASTFAADLTTSS